MVKSKIIAAVLGLSVLLGFTGVAYANPVYFATGTTTSASTSTPAYMTAGNSTSTLTFNSYAPLSQSLHTGATQVGLLVQFSGSSTSAVLNMATEYSMDGVDWYRNFITSPFQLGATTSPFVIQTPYSMSWKYASTTLDGGIVNIPGMSTAGFILPSPFEWIREVFTISGANGAIWAAMVPLKETN